MDKMSSQVSLLDRSSDLDALLEAKSIAIIGASPRPGSASQRAISSLSANGYTGEVVLVSDRHEWINGMATYAHVADYDGVIDQALVLVPRDGVRDAIEQCAEAGVRCASVLAAGFSELGQEGKTLQKEVSRIASSRGMRLLGPNCLGAVNAHTGLVASVSTAFQAMALRPGGVSVISQSGALGVSVISELLDRDIGFRHFVSTGNEADITVSEALVYAARDAKTRVIFMYVEGVRDPQEFLEALAIAKMQGKRLVVLKAGGTDVGANAILSHTAAIAGDDAVYSELLTRAGAHRTSSISESVEAIELALAPERSVRVNRLAVVSSSGGMGLVAGEYLIERGFELPIMPDRVQKLMHDIVPFSGTQNPIDATGHISFRPDHFRPFMELALSPAEIDGAIIILGYSAFDRHAFSVIVEGIIALARTETKFLAVVGIIPPEFEDLLRRVGVYFSNDIPRVAERLCVMRGASSVHLEKGSVINSVVPGVKLNRSSKVVASEPLDEIAAITLLEQWGVPFPSWQPCDSEAEVFTAARGLGFPVVLKLIEPGVLHKSERGFVVPGIADEEHLRSGLAKLSSVRGASGRFLVQRMIEPGIAELIVAVRRDPTAGLAFVIGLGGIHAELLADTVVLLEPFTEEDVVSALRRLKLHPILFGARGRPEADTGAIADVVEVLRRLATARSEILEIEINPLIVYASGAIGVDGVVQAAAI